MATHTFSLTTFQQQVPALANTALAVLQGMFGVATNFICSNDSPFGGLCGARLTLALNLLTAHLVQLSNTMAAGGTPGVVTGAGEGTTNVTLLAPPAKDGWQFYLAQTPYGQALWALLIAASMGGFGVGGSPERAAFRRAGGVF